MIPMISWAQKLSLQIQLAEADAVAPAGAPQMAVSSWDAAPVKIPNGNSITRMMKNRDVMVRCDLADDGVDTAGKLMFSGSGHGTQWNPRQLIGLAFMFDAVAAAMAEWNTAMKEAHAGLRKTCSFSSATSLSRAASFSLRASTFSLSLARRFCLLSSLRSLFLTSLITLPSAKAIWRSTRTIFACMAHRRASSASIFSVL